nr:hypothetical protein GCM10020063_040680 [Dactylosporangium thailandense]
MPRTVRLILVVAVCLTGIGAPAAAWAAESGYVKFYTVAKSYDGAAENLTEIASRFLGDGRRAEEIFTLNVGRPQPAGASLADPAQLRAGWYLVLPWDAVGNGVAYGLLPAAAPASAPATTAAPPATMAPPAPRSTATGSAPAGVPDTGRRPSPASPAPASSAPVGTAAPVGCATAAPAATADAWAQNTVAADKAWPRSRGKGQVVAVVDSGVNGRVARLSGHVNTGADVSSASGRGDNDCLGTGTAIAGLIVAQADQSGSGAGVAPDAVVLPIRVVGSTPRADPSRQVAAIKAAVSGNAGVIALGQYIDLADRDVVAAITDALGHDVLVIVEAPPAVPASASTNVFTTQGPELPADDALIRVGGIGADGKQPLAYRPGAVDVVAPAVGVEAVAMGGGTAQVTGTHLAVAFVAGVAALVRAAGPGLDAKQAGRIVRTSSAKVGDGKVPDRAFGYGMVNAAAAVGAVPDANAGPIGTTTASRSGGGSGRWILLLGPLLLLGAGGYLLLRGLRRRRGGSAEEDWPAVADEPWPQPPVPQPAARPRVAEMAMSMPVAGRMPEPEETYGPRTAEAPAASASDWRAARNLAGTEEHWSDRYDESAEFYDESADDGSAYDDGGAGEFGPDHRGLRDDPRLPGGEPGRDG